MINASPTGPATFSIVIEPAAEMLASAVHDGAHAGDHRVILESDSGDPGKVL